MHVLAAYSQPRGKYGRYVFTVMIHFAEETESVKIAVMRPEKQTRTAVKYSCDHCGRWASITTHETVTVNTPLQAGEYQKDATLELYRYDNVEPDDFIELTLRNSEMFKYQITRINIKWDGIEPEGYWRLPRFDKVRDDLTSSEEDPKVYKRHTDKDAQRYISGVGYRDTEEYKTWLKERNKARAELREKESLMKDEIIYDVILLPWDVYIQEKTGDVSVEEELIHQTMNAEEITITELLMGSAVQLPAIEGEKHFIEGKLQYLP